MPEQRRAPTRSYWIKWYMPMARGRGASPITTQARKTSDGITRGYGGQRLAGDRWRPAGGGM